MAPRSSNATTETLTSSVLLIRSPTLYRRYD
jgi:hypothetical protein